MRNFAIPAFVIAVCGAVLSAQPTMAADRAIAPGGTLRAVYLASNPAQAVQDRASGAIRGVSADLARELARRIGMEVEIKPVADPKAVINAVSGDEADIGFVAFEPSRAGTVEFSQTYMLVRQSFLVLEESGIRAIADIDRAGQKIAGTRNDSITLFMKRKFCHAALLEIDNNPAEIRRLLAAKEIDAFGANRQRLTNLMKDAPGLRLLPDSLFGVPQTIIVPKGRAEVLSTVNRFIDDVRASGFLQRSIESSGVIGLEAAPAGSWQPSVPDYEHDSEKREPVSRLREARQRARPKAGPTTGSGGRRKVGKDHAHVKKTVGASPSQKTFCNCLLLEAEPTWPNSAATSAIDPGRVKTSTFNLRVEIPSRFRRFENQQRWQLLSKANNREKNSALYFFFAASISCTTRAHRSVSLLMKR